MADTDGNLWGSDIGRGDNRRRENSGNGRVDAVKYFFYRPEFRALDWLVLGLVLLLGFGWGASEAYRWLTFDDRAPLTGLRLEPQNAPIRVGESLVVRSYREKVRDDCAPVISIRAATNSSTGKVTPLPSRVWEGGSVEADHVDLVFDTTSLSAGLYIGRAQAIYPCPGMVVEYNAEFAFEVLPIAGKI